ncbi:MAG: Fic family protein [Lentisphaeria bacterium]
MADAAVLAEVKRTHPHLRFARHWEVGEEVSFLLGKCAAMAEAIGTLPLAPEKRKELMRVALIKGAQATTAIEGNSLSDEQVAKVADGIQLSPSMRYQEVEVRNVIDALNTVLRELCQGGDAPVITPDLILNFHRAVGKDLGEHLDAAPGRFRERGVQVGGYLAPKHPCVKPLVEALCEWLRREFSYDGGRHDFRLAMVEAVVTHLYIAWIHPFSDGNGRTARLLEFYILTRCGLPDLAAHILSNHYNLTRPEYYRQIGQATANGGNLSAFLRYAVTGLHDGMRDVLSVIERHQLDTCWRNHVYARLDEERGRLDKARRKRLVAVALQLELLKDYGADELLQTVPGVAAAYVGKSLRTFHRDLEDLERLTILRRQNGKLGANLDAIMPHLSKRRLVRPGAESA